MGKDKKEYDNNIQNFFNTFFKDTKGEEEKKKEDNLSKDKYLETLIKEFYDVSNLELKTDLKENQIGIVTKAMAFANYFDNDLLKNVIFILLKVSISKNRKGREEFNEIFKYANQKLLETDKSDLFKGIFGSDF